MRPIAVVIGGAGSLGKSIVRCFRNQQYKVLSVDYKENLDADHSFLLSPETFSSLSSNGLKNGTSIPHWLIEGNRMETELIKLKNGSGFRAVVSVAGGWAGGHPRDPSFLHTVDQMWKMNGQSAALACSIAAKTLDRHGLFVLTGAKGALGPTPGMMGYGMAKVATHQIVQSMAADEGMSQFTTLGILPAVIDTPMNRQGMPDAKFSDWTPCMEIAERVEQWSSQPESRPQSGSLVEIHTADGKTEWIVKK